MIINHEIDIDLVQPGCTPMLHATQGDLGSRSVTFRLHSGRKIWEPPDGTSVLVRYRNPYGGNGTYDTLSDGTPAGSVIGNTVTVFIVPEVLALPGSVSLAVTLLAGTQVLSAFNALLMVQPSLSASSYFQSCYTNVLGFLPAPETAEAGQHFEAEEVSSSGQVLRVKAVDASVSEEQVPVAGADGFSPIASVTQTQTGATISITDQSGTTTAVITNGTDGDSCSIAAEETEAGYYLTIANKSGVDAASSTKLIHINHGTDGISAYEYAVAGGYTGTEAEFAQKLAEEPLIVMLQHVSDATDYFTPSHSAQEIQAAYDAGRSVMAVLEVEEVRMDLPLSFIASSDEDEVLIAFFSGASFDMSVGCPANAMVMIVDNGSDSFAEYYIAGLALLDDLPTALPNPNPMIINGFEYNGETRVNYTAAINAMIDGKIPAVPTKTSELTNDSGYLTSAPVTSVNGQTGAVSLDIPTALPNPNALTINGISYDGSAPVEVVVSGGSVSDGETQTVLSDNLFDKTTVTEGQLFYHSSSGPVLTTSTNVCWAYVPLRGAGTYRTKVNQQEHAGTYATRVPILTDDKTFLQNVTGTVTETDNVYAYDLEFTITADMVANGAALYAFDCHTTILNTVMIVKDMDYPSTYIPYGYIEVSVESDSVSDKQNNVLRGKTAVFLGDSICAGTTVGDDSEYYGYGWAGLIGEANKMTWKNYGRNGGTVTDLAAVAEARWLSTQADLAYAAYPDADYVIFQGGCNDADQMKDALLGEIASDYATFDTTTFSGALESLILKLLTNFPTAKVGYIIPQKMYAQNDHSAAGHVHRRFFDRAIEICEKWGIPYVDLWKGNPLNPKLSTASLFYTDGQHLTLAGYQRITPPVEAWMRAL